MASPLSRAQNDELAEIARKNGGTLSNEDLLAAVQKRGEKSSLYLMIFDCGDDDAAYRYRLERCRWILRHASFSFRAVGNPEPMETRRVLSVKGEKGLVFMLTERAVKKHRRSLVGECKDELIEWRRKWTAILGQPKVDEILEFEAVHEQAAE